jgi:hypothetical protein
MERKNLRDSDQAGSRTRRTFEENGNWFFKTREGELAGPFRDELEASTRLEVYIRLVNSGLPSANESV